MSARIKRIKDFGEAVKGLKFTKGNCEESKRQLKEVYNKAPRDEKKWCKVHLVTEGLNTSILEV